MKNFLTLIILLNTLFALGQEEKDYKKVISVSELEVMLKNGPIDLINMYIKIDAVIIGEGEKKRCIGKDAKYYKKEYFKNGSLKGYTYTGLSNINSTNIIHFRECKFDNIYFRNCSFNEIHFMNCVIYGSINIEKTEVNKGLYFSFCTLKNAIFNITNCNINEVGCYGVKGTGDDSSWLYFKNNSINNFYFASGKLNEIYINACTFSSPFSISGDYNLMTIEDNKCLIVDSLFFREVENTVNTTYEYDENYTTNFISILNSNINNLNISKNVFIYNDNFNLSNNIYNYEFNGTSIQELLMQNETIERVNFDNTSFSKSLTLDSVTINRSFSAKGIQLPEYDINFTWVLFKNKLNFTLTDSTSYNVFTTANLSNEELYNEYISTLIKFFTLFKTRGDLKSANACYVEMKDAETKRLKYLFEKEKNIDNYLNYNLNRFLKFFALYGTSPTQSVKISGWVILIFGFFYFFFYSEWDKINRKFLITKSELLIGYFRSEQKLEDLYSDKHKDDLSTFTNFKQNLKDSKAEIPFFFMLFLKPLYWLAVLKLNFNKSLYKRVEFLQGRWVDLTKGKKVLLGTLTFLTILTYGIYLITIRSLNSLILSINTFTTLGFGDIPVVGISRYVAILEGFLGWFLLSIFSVSLISQILQN